MTSAQDIINWFADACTRHPSIRHDASDVKKYRFFPLVWDELVNNASAIAAKEWTVILEDYAEGLSDNTGDYFSRVPQLAFMVLKHVPIGKQSERATAFADAQTIAEDLLAKLYADAEDEEDADLPAGVPPPHVANINTVRIIKVMPPMFDNAVGIRLSVDLRTHDNVDLSRTRVAWLPLP